MLASVSLLDLTQLFRELKQRLLDTEADAREERIRQLEEDDEDAAYAQKEMDDDKAVLEHETLDRLIRVNRPNKFIGGRGGGRLRPKYFPDRNDLNFPDRND
jgi:hypothetical protein